MFGKNFRSEIEFDHFHLRPGGSLGGERGPDDEAVGLREQALHGTPWASMARHMLGLRHGLRGARRWRQIWSDHQLKELPVRQVAAMAALAHTDEAAADGA